MPTDFVSGRIPGCLALQFFGDRIANEIGEPDAVPIEACTQLGIEFHWQANGDGHFAVTYYST
jgi:hypothetical protein